MERAGCTPPMVWGWYEAPLPRGDSLLAKPLDAARAGVVADRSGLGHRPGAVTRNDVLDPGDRSEQPPKPFECLPDLARHDPQLVRVALRDLRKGLQVLISKQPLIRVTVVDRLEDSGDRLRLPPRAGRLRLRVRIRPYYRRLGFAARLEHGRLLLALRGQDRGLLRALRRQDRRALVALGSHLLLHRVLDGCWWLDRLQLHPADPDAPLARRLVELTSQLAVDVVA